MARVTLTLAQLVTVTATTSLPALLSSTEEGRTEYLGVAGGLAAAITVAWPVWRVILCIQRRFPARARQKGPDVEPGLCDQPEDQDDDRWAVLVDQSTRLWPPAGDEEQMQAELVDLEAKENVEVRYAEGFQPLDPCESAASQLRLFSQKRQGQTSPVKGNSQSNQDFANEVGELGTVHAEAGNEIEASDAPDVSKPQPLQIDLKQGQFVGRPALQLRNFRSFDGNAAGKDGAGKAERGARGESGNVTLPGSVPVTAAADGFDLVAEAAREAQPGAQLEEEQTTKNQDSANHVSELGTAHAEAGNGIEASDAPDVSKPQPLQTDLKQGLFVGRPALQLRNFRSFDGNAAGKDGAGKAERGARGESGNVTLPGSVPVTAAADGFDLVAEAAREAQPGAQLEEEQTTKNQDSANHVSELGTVHAEAGNGIEASDAPDVSKPQPLQIDLKQGQFVGRPALQLRNFRSFDGNAAGKDGAGKAERGARGESGNVTLPGSVPVTAAADGFDLVAEAAREAQPGAQLEEQTTKNQDSANHVSGLATVGIEASDAPDISKTVTEPSQTDLKQELSIRSPAIQLRHLRSQKSVSPKFRKDPRAGRGSSESPHALAGGRRRPFSEAESRSRPSRSSRSASPERVVETKKKSDGTNGIAAQLVEDKADLGELGEPEAVQSEENCNGQLSPALNLRDLRSSMALHQQRKEELEKCVANFAQSEQFHQCIMQTEQAHALLQQLLPQGKPGQPGKSEDSPKRLQQQQPYLLSVALKRAGETEPAVKLDSLASDGARPSMP